MNKKMLKEIIRNKLLVEQSIDFKTFLKLMKKVDNLNEQYSTDPSGSDFSRRVGTTGTYAVPAVTAANIALPNIAAGTTTLGSMSMTGAIPGAGTAMFALMRLLQAQRDNCVRSCGEFSVFGGLKRKLCMDKCHFMLAQQEVGKLEQIYGDCNGNEACQQMVAQKIEVANQRLANALQIYMNTDTMVKQHGIKTDFYVDPKSKHSFFSSKRKRK